MTDDATNNEDDWVMIEDAKIISFDN